MEQYKKSEIKEMALEMSNAINSLNVGEKEKRQILNKLQESVMPICYMILGKNDKYMEDTFVERSMDFQTFVLNLPVDIESKKKVINSLKSFLNFIIAELKRGRKSE